MTWGGNAMRWGSRAGAGDSVAPTIVGVSPASGNMLGPTDPIVFDVLDETELAAVIVWLVMPDQGGTEVVHDGDQFTARYLALSTRAAIAGGYRYTLRRTGGWPGANVSVRIKALDFGGNEPT